MQIKPSLKTISESWYKSNIKEAWTIMCLAWFDSFTVLDWAALHNKRPNLFAFILLSLWWKPPFSALDNFNLERRNYLERRGEFKEYECNKISYYSWYIHLLFINLYISPCFQIQKPECCCENCSKRRCTRRDCQEGSQIWKRGCDAFKSPTQEFS